jgi:hypothetical protein
MARILPEAVPLQGSCMCFVCRQQAFLSPMHEAFAFWARHAVVHVASDRTLHLHHTRCLALVAPPALLEA